MEKKETVEHEAIIKKINKTTYEADVLVKSACISCQLKGVCSVSEMEQKRIIIQKDKNKDVRVGEKVTVFISQEKGLKAVFLGYILPFLLVMVALIIGLFITKNEGVAGILGLSVLAPYYFVLYLLKDKLEKEYKFSIT